MTAPLMPGAEPWSADGGPVGVLVVHGFTGNPQSMRPLAEAFAAAGHTVSLPLLPGHGTRVEDMLPTRWEDWSAAVEQAYGELAARCEGRVRRRPVDGRHADPAAREPPPGGARHRAGQPARGRAGARITATVEQLRALGEPLSPGIGSDIALEGSVESAYPMTPVEPLLSLHAALADLRAALGSITCPVLLLTSPQDHVVEPVSSDLVAAGVRGPVERVALERSFHVATLDHDAALVERAAVDFVHRVTMTG
jgi:carboxylesterase